jgi:hypothetical protein
METPLSNVTERVLLSARGQDVSAADSLIGVVVGSQVHAKDSLILVASARYISGDAKILFQGRSLLLAAIAGVSLATAICYLLRHK